MTFPEAALYLQIPASYCRSIGGLRWAHYGEAVEFLEGPAAGLTFAFAPEIALFLEGFRGTEGKGGVPAFGHILHLLYLIGLGDRAGVPEGRSDHRMGRIAERFRAEGCPLRNAGALCAAISTDAPRAADAPELSAIHEILTDGNWVPSVVLASMMPLAIKVAEEPGLDPDQFEALISRRLEKMSDVEVRHWLRYGRGPMAQTAERLILDRPRIALDVFSEMERRPRLAGTLALAARLEGLLWFPSRRLERPELQGGGYTDITTRGAPERILPIQLALDGEEFIRRFAEGELLYFNREEPREPLTEELVLLLDQGVRTWGDVRLVLSSAVIALARQAGRRHVIVKLAATSNDGEPVDLTTIEPAALSILIEASDLSPHPAEALQRLFATAQPGRRDVVVLTHPQNLIEPEVRAAAASSDRHAGTRLFAVTVDWNGRLELAELRRGLPIVLARSRIEIEPAAVPLTLDASAPKQTAKWAWTGEFDPIGFPFCCGLLERLEHPGASGGDLMSQPFDFDESGERILAVGDGLGHLLFTCTLDGTEGEHLPMPVFKQPTPHLPIPLQEKHWVLIDRQVIGVAGGFVVSGYRSGGSCLVHYDFPSRRCVLHRLDDIPPSVTWSYFRDLHAIAMQPVREDEPYRAIDLSARGSGATGTSRARRAAQRAAEIDHLYNVIPPAVCTAVSEPSVVLNDRVLRLDRDSGLLHFRPSRDLQKSVMPLSDGQPALKGGQIVRARRGGDVLAVLVRGAAADGLYFISIWDCAVIGNFPCGQLSHSQTFALARDGRRFALVSAKGELEVREVSGSQTAVFVARREAVATHFGSLGRSCLLVREVDEESHHVRDRCLIRWDRGRIEVERHEAFSVFSRLGGVLAQSRSLRRGDREIEATTQMRFHGVIEGAPLRILIDPYNHFVVFDGRGNLVCILYAIGDEVAALLVDGTYWGSRRLIGREVIPGASERIGRALLEAEGIPESSS
jgi:hypothetical protein